MSISKQLPKACVILGAGASHDVSSGSPAPINDDWRPPLAKELFDFKSRRNFYGILKRYDSVIASKLEFRISSGSFDLEKELLGFANHPDESIRNAYKQIPPYLRDLIYEAAQHFTEVPTNYIELATTLLADYKHEVLFLTLNYDDLLEKALAFDNQLIFGSVEDYIKEHRRAKVVKLHGSIDWFSILSTSMDQKWDDLVRKANVFAKPPDAELQHFRGVGSSRKFHDGNWLYPILTAPLAGKGELDFVCPQSHVKFAQGFLKDCSKFLVIGASGRDNDLLHLLNTSVQPDSDAVLHIVSQGDSREVLERFRDGVDAFSIAADQDFNYGFGRYLESPLFRQFADA